MSRMMKTLMILLIVVYAFAPDPIPGPIDDLALAALGYTLNRRMTTS